MNADIVTQPVRRPGAPGGLGGRLSAPRGQEEARRRRQPPLRHGRFRGPVRGELRARSSAAPGTRPGRSLSDRSASPSSSTDSPASSSAVIALMAVDERPLFHPVHGALSGLRPAGLLPVLPALHPRHGRARDGRRPGRRLHPGLADHDRRLLLPDPVRAPEAGQRPERRQVSRPDGARLAARRRRGVLRPRLPVRRAAGRDGRQDRPRPAACRSSASSASSSSASG